MVPAAALALLFAPANAPAAAAPQPPALVALAPIDAEAGVDEAVARDAEVRLVRLLTLRHASVLGPDDVRRRLGAERVWRLWRCPDAACIRDAGQRLPVDAMLAGSVSLLGPDVVVELRLVRLRGPPTSAIALRTAQVDLARSLPEAVTAALDELWPPPPRAPRAATAAVARARPSVTPWWVAGIGFVTAVLGAGLVDYALGESHPFQVAGATRYSYTWTQAQLANTEGAMGEVVFAAGLGVMIGGLTWGIVRPSSEEATLRRPTGGD